MAFDGIPLRRPFGLLTRETSDQGDLCEWMELDFNLEGT